MGDNQEIKRKLVESGVIGRVLDDFNPRLGLNLQYGDTQIILGDEVTPAEVQRKPTYLELDSDPLDVEFLETFTNPELVVLIMTDPDAPGGEYLHWLTLPFPAFGYDIDSPAMELVAYEPPRSGAHMLVLTFFQAQEFQTIVVPNSRENFSTRTYAHTNAFGSPLGASFFNIKYENEDEKQKSESRESSTCNGVGPCSKRKDNGSISNTCDGAGPCSKRQKNGSTSNTSISAGSCTKLQHNGSTSNPKEIPESESTSKRRRISVSAGSCTELQENGSISNTCISAGSCSKRKENGSTSNTCVISGSCTKRQENGSTSNPKENPVSTSKRRRISVSLGAAFSRINY